jgi:A/G-specific adenine glycosylase
VREAAVVVRRGGRVLLRRHAAGERWAGLWDFPRFVLSGRPGAGTQSALIAGVQQLCGLHVEPGEHLATIKHGVTRFRISLECYAACSESGRAHGECKWVPPGQLGVYALSTTGRKIARLLVSDR